MDLERFKKWIEDVGSSLEYDGDWMPAIFLENAKLPEGSAEGPGRGNMVFVLAPLFIDEEGKNQSAKAITEIIAVAQPEAVCFTATAWLSMAPIENKDEIMAGTYIRPSMDPNRKEVVICLCVGNSGENDGETIMYGYVERSDGPPNITHWDIMSEEGETSQGRFAEAIRKGFERIKGE